MIFHRPAKEDLTVCIISPERDNYAQTFIRAHMERLPARVKPLYGGSFPSWQQDGRPLLASDPLSRATRALFRRLGIQPLYFQNRSFRKFLRNNRIDVVLAEVGPSGAAVMEACGEEGIPLVVHFHGPDISDNPLREKMLDKYRAMFEFASAVVAVSHHMRRQLIEIGAPPEKVFYNPCGADLAIFKGARPEQAPPRFLAVGRFFELKAPHLTLLAFSRVIQSEPKARLVMIGEGALLGPCVQLSKALHMAHAVQFRGAQPPSAVADAMRESRAFVQHSMRTREGISEGTPVAVLEAGAAGLPVVATRHAGIAEVVSDGETGFLVGEGDVDGMAERMLCLAKEPDLAASLGRRAHERVVREYSMEHRIGRLWQILRSAVSGSESGTTAAHLSGAHVEPVG